MEWRLGETGKANQKTREIWNFSRHLMRGPSLVGIWKEYPKREERIWKEIKSAHIGYLDKAIRIKGFQF